MKAKTVKEVLIAGRWILENIGWCQGSYYKDKNGEARSDVFEEGVAGNVDCACSLGCIYLTEVDDDQLQYRATALLDNICSKIGKSYSVSDWNDHPDRTKEEVLAVFDKAIKAA